MCLCLPTAARLPTTAVQTFKSCTSQRAPWLLLLLYRPPRSARPPCPRPRPRPTRPPRPARPARISSELARQPGTVGSVGTLDILARIVQSISIIVIIHNFRGEKQLIFENISNFRKKSDFGNNFWLLGNLRFLENKFRFLESFWIVKDEVKQTWRAQSQPEGPPTRSRGPTGPQTSSNVIMSFLHCASCHIARPQELSRIHLLSHTWRS